LVITGTEDRLIKPISSEVMASLVPKAKLVKVEGGSYNFSVEMRSEFNREVLDFPKN
jgi:pimeloyl-ACP methyl ester carboxylesterase